MITGTSGSTLTESVNAVSVRAHAAWRLGEVIRFIPLSRKSAKGDIR